MWSQLSEELSRLPTAAIPVGLLSVIFALAAVFGLWRGRRGAAVPFNYTSLLTPAATIGIAFGLSFLRISWISALVVCSVITIVWLLLNSRVLLRHHLVHCVFSVIFILANVQVGMFRLARWPVELPPLVGKLLQAASLRSEQQRFLVKKQALTISQLPADFWAKDCTASNSRTSETLQRSLLLEDATLELDPSNNGCVTVLRFSDLRLLNSTIITHGLSLRLRGSRLEATQSSIVSFISPTRDSTSVAPGSRGVDGRSGGEVTIEVDKIDPHDKLKIDLAGQPGGNGGDGLVGAPGRPGTNGYNASDSLFSCAHAGQDGSPGGVGSPGQDGGAGGNGGDGGWLVIVSAHPDDILDSINFHSTGAPGGEGGSGGNGGPGGLGGEGGSGSSFCGGGHAGPRAQDGPGGMKGIAGNPGTAHPTPKIVRIH